MISAVQEVLLDQAWCAKDVANESWSMNLEPNPLTIKLALKYCSQVLPKILILETRQEIGVASEEEPSNCVCNCLSILCILDRPS